MMSSNVFVFFTQCIGLEMAENLATTQEVEPEGSVSKLQDEIARCENCCKLLQVHCSRLLEMGGIILLATTTLQPELLSSYVL